MKRWSKLQKELYKLINEDSNFQIHCIAFPMNSQRGSTSIPRYYITVEKEIIWDYPSDFKNITDKIEANYPYSTDVSEISQLIREYIDAPRDGLLLKNFPTDKWGLTTIFKIHDRRIGKNQLLDWSKNEIIDAKILKLIEKRINKRLKL